MFFRWWKRPGRSRFANRRGVSAVAEGSAGELVEAHEESPRLLLQEIELHPLDAERIRLLARLLWLVGFGLLGVVRGQLVNAAAYLGRGLRIRWIDDWTDIEEVDVEQLPQDGSVRELREAILLDLEAEGDLTDVSPADALKEIPPERRVWGQDLKAESDLVLLQLERPCAAPAKDQIGAVVEESADVRVLLQGSGEGAAADHFVESSEILGERVPDGGVTDDLWWDVVQGPDLDVRRISTFFISIHELPPCAGKTGSMRHEHDRMSGG